MKKEYSVQFNGTYSYNKDGSVEIEYGCKDSDGLKMDGKVKEENEAKAYTSLLNQIKEEILKHNKEKLLKQKEPTKPQTQEEIIAQLKKEKAALQQELNKANVDNAVQKARIEKLTEKNKTLTDKEKNISNRRSSFEDLIREMLDKELF